ncbi:MAG: hypothetical protein GX286_07305 [Clostridiales bacterium]|jgi:lysophospholipase L1-like esterase|nr:hypothetical protein [Clostridiales bacterium]
MQSIRKDNLLMVIFAVLIVFITADIPKVESKKECINYVALGDSIAAGYGLADGESSYVDLISEDLGARTTNLAVSGMTSTELLQMLSSGEHDEVISKADIITISIGSNDLLKPFISRVTKAFGIENAEDINNNVISELTKKYKNDPFLLIPVIAELNSQIVENEELYGICKKFEVKIFPQIISQIKVKNPDAQIIVNNIYNPYYNVSIYGLFDLGRIADSYINKINMAFSDSSKYEYVDIYKIFKENGLTNSHIDFLSLDTLSFDPHPNKDGHMMIFSAVNSKINVD